VSSNPKFACQWDSDKQISSCFLAYYYNNEANLACGGCPEHDVWVGETLYHVSYELRVDKGKKVIATVDVKNEGDSGACNLRVVDRQRNVVLATATKNISAGWIGTMDTYFNAEEDGEVWLELMNDIGEKTDELGPIPIKILRPKLYDPSTNAMITAKKDDQVVQVVFPGKSGTADTACVFYAIADVVNESKANTYKCSLQVWDWNRNKGYAWKEFTIAPGEKKTISTDGFTLEEGDYKFTIVLWVWEDNKWKSVDATDTISYHIEKAEMPPPPPKNPNPKFAIVKYTINGNDYYPPFEVEVEKGTTIKFYAKIKNEGDAGNCFVKLWDGYSAQTKFSKTIYIGENDEEEISTTLTANEYLYLYAYTGYDNTTTDSSPYASIKIKEEVPPPQPPIQPPTPPQPPVQPPIPPPLPPDLNKEYFGIPLWAWLIAGGIIAIGGAIAYYQEKKREEMMMLLLARR